MSWRVRRVSGLLFPGFRKRFMSDTPHGVTTWLGVPIGRFDIVPVEGEQVELRYVGWPAVDVLAATPTSAEGRPVHAAGYVLMPGGRRVRFCQFLLEPPGGD